MNPKDLLRRGEWIASRLLWLRGRRIEIMPGARVRASRLRAAPGARISVSEGALVEAHIVAERPGAVVEIGTHTFIGSSAITCAKRVTIGPRVLIAWGCGITDHDSHSLDWRTRRDDAERWTRGEKDWSGVAIAPVTIEEGAWVGMHAIILKGVTIGARSVVAAGSVVVRDVPPDTLVAGNPARAIRRLNEKIRE
jgi:acetyltransferase-like isoleucine patch superfamily enzyme